MATGLLALLDDVTSMLDDVAAMAKKATTKAVGVASDDSLVNAEQVSSIRTKGELSIVAHIALGSLLNKAILVPVLLAIVALAPWLMKALLIAGSLYLCFEGAEKVLHAKSAKHETPDPDDAPAVDVPARIKAAIRTDFVLSAEILVIGLAQMEGHPIVQQAMALSAVGLVMTALVYGVVAIIVRLDDMGLWLSARPSPLAQRAGQLIVRSVPAYMRLLSVAGLIAMLMVGGDILVHNTSAHHIIAPLLEQASLPAAIESGAATLIDAALALVVGALVVKTLELRRLLSTRSPTR